jgi:hypothetical protein
MGKRSKEHRQAVLAGKEAPFRQPEWKRPTYFRCRTCGMLCTEYQWADHCWRQHQVDITKSENQSI